MREIGGRKDRVVRGGPSVRFGRGFFSSISETDSTGALGGAGAGLSAEAAAAAAAAARERAAGVGAIAVLRAVFTAGDLAALGFAAADSEADLVAFPAAGDLRAVVLLVVLVGMCSKSFHGSGLSARLAIYVVGVSRGTAA